MLRLPQIRTEHFKRCFINRCLFNFIELFIVIKNVCFFGLIKSFIQTEGNLFSQITRSHFRVPFALSSSLVTESLEQAISLSPIKMTFKLEPDSESTTVKSTNFLTTQNTTPSRLEETADSSSLCSPLRNDEGIIKLRRISLLLMMIYVHYSFDIFS